MKLFVFQCIIKQIHWDFIVFYQIYLTRVEENICIEKVAVNVCRLCFYSMLFSHASKPKYALYVSRADISN